MIRKKKFTLTIAVSVDSETGNVGAVYFRIREGKSHLVREFADGNAFADYDRKGNLLGIELLAPCEVTVLDRIAKTEPEPVKKFLHNSIPREMALV